MARCAGEATVNRLPPGSSINNPAPPLPDRLRGMAKVIHDRFQEPDRATAGHRLWRRSHRTALGTLRRWWSQLANVGYLIPASRANDAALRPLRVNSLQQRLPPLPGHAHPATPILV